VEPIASSGAGAVFRPGGGASEASALLKDGRLLRAEVLSSSHDGAVMLAIGRHTIPAQSDLRLDPGARLLVQVALTAEGPQLLLLPPGDDPESALLGALRAAVGEERPLGETLGDLAHALRTALAGGESAPEARALSQVLSQEMATQAPALDGAGLRALLASLGLAHEAGLALALESGRRGGLGALRDDLKARLLRMLDAQGAGSTPLREAAGHALASLETEQLLNLARERSGEPVVLSFPVADGDGWATARLLVPARREREAEDAAAAPAPFRLTLGLELSSLGPLRADLTLAPGVLALRILVTRADAARRLTGALAELRERLGDGRRVLELSVRLGTPAEASLGLEPLDIRYLREHHLMNVAG
jgi:flagellar hook-length control protein FliK